MKRQQQEEQENSERFYLDAFLSALGIEPESVVRGTNPPDFVVRRDSRLIAVEVTGFHDQTKTPDGYPRRAVEAGWLEIQTLLERERVAYPDLDRVATLLFFRELRVPQRCEYAQFAKELLDFVRGSRGLFQKVPHQFGSFPAKYTLLAKYLKRIDLWDASCHVAWEWNHTAGSVGLDQADMECILSPKLQRSRPSGVEDAWLLVVSGPQLSQHMGLPRIDEIRDFRELNDALERGPYDKVYIFQYMLGRVLVWCSKDGWDEVRGGSLNSSAT